MKTQPKFLTLTCLAVSIFFLGLNIEPASAQNTIGEKKWAVELSDEEKAWRAQHPLIRLGFNPDMQPLLIQNANGAISGIVPDIFDQLKAITGLNISVEIRPWPATINLAKQGEIDGLLTCVPALADAIGLSRTREYIPTIPVVFAKSDASFEIANLDDLKGKCVAYLRAVKFVENILAPLGSETTAIPTDSFIDALTLVLEGKADVALGMNFDTYFLNKSVLTGIEPIFIDTSHIISAVTAVRSDWPELVRILNKGLETLGEARINKIIAQWTQPGTSIQTVDLTQAEKAWLKQHPVMRLGVVQNWAPVEYLDAEGKLAGITSDHIRILSEKMSTHFEAAEGLSWSEVLQQARQGEIDVISAIVKSEERAEYLLFTEPYLRLPMVIVTRDDAPVIEGIQDLKGRTIAVIKEVITHAYLKRDYPDQELLLFKTLDEALQAVDDGQADALIENAACYNLAKQKLGLTRLTVAAPTPYAYELSIGVRQDWPEIVPILEKTLASITMREKQIIKEKWGDIRFQRQTDWRVVIGISLAIALIAGGVVTIIAFSNRRLAREVNRRKQAREEAALAIASAHAGTMFFDIPQGRLAWDQRSMEIFGVDDKTFDHTFESWEKLVHPDDLSAIQKIIETQLETRKLIDIRYRIIRPDGEIRHVWANANIIRNRNGEPEALTGLHFDETERVLDRMNLQKAKDKAEAANRELTFTKFAFDNAPDAIEWLNAENAQMVYVNKLSGKMLGYSQEELMKLAVFDFDPVFHQEVWPSFRQELRHKGQMTFESRWQRKDGGQFPVEISARSLSFEGREYFLAFVRDISEKKQAQKDLQDAKEAAEAANQAKSVFLANMSHELRTPLNAILGFSSMLGGEAATTPAQKEKLAVINRSGEHLLSMINDILDLSKIEAGRIELEENPFDLVALLQEISAMIQSRAEEKGLAFVLETEAVILPYVNTDKVKLRQILINLLSNAVKFTRKGSITIRAATEPLPETPERCRIVLEIEDTGRGIDHARRTDIFEPFVQAQSGSIQSGTGLGLSICKNFCELMGGTIEVESEAGRGTLFRVRLPAEIVAPMDVHRPPSKSQVVGLAAGQRPWRILTADDHDDNRLLLKTLLEQAGFAVIEAGNGREALVAFEKENPDFIWMDMRMPVMDGYEAVKQIRQHPKGAEIPIVAITASVFQSQRQEIMAAGCDAMVFKPFQAQEIFEMIEKFLGATYIYAEPDETTTRDDNETELNAAALTALPAELRQDLAETTLVLNQDAILAVVDRIAVEAPQTAEKLRALVMNYEVERIREMLAE
jgi:PAS domain S-box-containing protein